MSKKPAPVAVTLPDIEPEIEPVAAPDGLTIPPPPPVGALPMPSDDVLMTYSISEATWLGVNNPAAFERWRELQRPKARVRPALPSRAE